MSGKHRKEMPKSGKHRCKRTPSLLDYSLPAAGVTALVALALGFSNITIPEQETSNAIQSFSLSETSDERYTVPAIPPLTPTGTVQETPKQKVESKTPIAPAPPVVAAPPVAVPVAGISLAGLPTTGFGGVKPFVAQAGHFLAKMFGFTTVLGKRGSAIDRCGHPAGLALDFMILGDTAKGNALAQYVLAHMGELKVKYVIWRQRVNYGKGWQGMENRGSLTANHMDHVHVNFIGC